ncbi:MAG: hypothetical protein PVH94_07205, partial [Desulfobacterales bacterium]
IIETPDLSNSGRGIIRPHRADVALTRRVGFDDIVPGLLIFHCGPVTADQYFAIVIFGIKLAFLEAAIAHFTR